MSKKKNHDVKAVKKYKLNGRYSCYYKGQKVIPGETVLLVPAIEEETFLELFHGNVTEIVYKGKRKIQKQIQSEPKATHKEGNPGIIPDHLDKDLNGESIAGKDDSEEELDELLENIDDDPGTEENIEPPKTGGKGKKGK